MRNFDRHPRMQHTTPVCERNAENIGNVYGARPTLVDPHTLRLRDPYRDRQTPAHLRMRRCDSLIELQRNLPLASPHAYFVAPHPDAVSLLATLHPFPQHCTSPGLIPCMSAKCIEEHYLNEDVANVHIALIAR